MEKDLATRPVRSRITEAKIMFAGTFGAPVEGFAAPAESFAAPVEGFGAPVESFAASAEGFRAPVEVFAANVEACASPAPPASPSVKALKVMARIGGKVRPPAGSPRLKDRKCRAPPGTPPSRK